MALRWPGGAFLLVRPRYPASLETAEYLEQRARRGRKEGFHAALAYVPDVEPDTDDKLER